MQKWCELYPHSLRLIGFGRLNPNQYPHAMKELEALVKHKGLRGLKLHPNSEDFMIGTENVKNVVKGCSKFNIPVIFHTTYGSEIKKLEEMANEIIVELFEAGEERFVSGLKIIPGHFMYNSSEVISCLSHPCLFGEMSLLNSPLNYLKKVREIININDFFENTLPKLTEMNPDITEMRLHEIIGPRLSNSTWSSKVMLGIDHPFLPFDKPVELMKALFHVDSKVTAGDIERILGANAMRLIPPKFFKGQGDYESLEGLSREEFIKHIISNKKNIFFDPLVIQSPVNQIRIWDGIISMRAKNGGYTGLCSLRKFVDFSGTKNKIEMREKLMEITTIQDLLIVDGEGHLTREFRDAPGILSTFFNRTSGMLDNVVVEGTKDLIKNNVVTTGIKRSEELI